MISKLSNPDVIEFIQENLNEDPSTLVLKGANYPDLPIKEIAVQIASRQKARKKLPEWYKNKMLIFPPKENLEQASSQETAKYKASLYSGDSVLDLTGGTGIDLFYLSQNFKKSLYVESSIELSELAKHNFSVLGVDIQVNQYRAEDFIANTDKQFDLIYLDPSRRSESNQRLVQIQDYQPNIISILPHLMEKGRTVVVKVSPMVDIRQSIKQFKYVSKVICLAVRNEMKEVLIELKKEGNETPVIETVNIKLSGIDCFKGTALDENNAISTFNSLKKYIYESNSAIRKAGFYKLIGERFKLDKLDPNTHLYTSDDLINEFPGRILTIKEIIKPDKKTLKKQIPSRVINVISKNYPLNANEIKKKYQLIDGGDDFLVFCTVFELGKICLRCSRRL